MLEITFSKATASEVKCGKGFSCGICRCVENHNDGERSICSETNAVITDEAAWPKECPIRAQAGRVHEEILLSLMSNLIAVEDVTGLPTATLKLIYAGQALPMIDMDEEAFVWPAVVCEETVEEKVIETEPTIIAGTALPVMSKCGKGFCCDVCRLVDWHEDGVRSICSETGEVLGDQSIWPASCLIRIQPGRLEEEILLSIESGLLDVEIINDVEAESLRQIGQQVLAKAA